MRSGILSTVALLLMLVSSSSFAALQRVGDFALLDHRGEFHQLSRYQHKDALVVMAFAAQCESMAAQVEHLQALRSQYQEQNIEFLLIDSQGLGRASLSGVELDMAILNDETQLVSEALGITQSGDVLVLNPQRLSLFFRGAASAELNTTLATILSDGLTDTVVAANSGCEIQYPTKDLHQTTPPDYTSEVAPIIVDKCSECHRQGGVGPFALDSYIMLLGWSPMIKEVLLNKRMPPAQVDPYIGHSDNARYLAKEELQTLVHWINGGAPRGEGADDPLELLEVPTGTNWAFGEPDYIATGPAIDVPATGIMDYIYEDIELSFDEDKWVRAIQYKAGSESVLHHLMTFVTAPDEDFWGAERESESVTRRFLEGYAPGQNNAVEFAPGTAVFIPSGYKLSMQFHYVTNGQKAVDETQLALYFSDEPDLKEKLTHALAARFVLPPNEPNFALSNEHVFSEDVVITGVRARMNARGKKMKFAIEQADGSLQEIFSVPAYNYGWQPHYILDEELLVPAGTKLHVIGALDNSISNPTNPDPEKEVPFGLDSFDEMFTGYFTYYKAAQ